MRSKIPEDKKSEKFAITIDEKLSVILDNYLEDNELFNKSKYIENLIRKDMEEKGKKIDREF